MKKHLLSLLALLGVSATSVFAGTLPGGQFAGVNVGTQYFFTQTSVTAPYTGASCVVEETQRYYLSGDINGDGRRDSGGPVYLRDNYTSVGDATNHYRLDMITPKAGVNQGTTVYYYTPASAVGSLNILQGTNTFSFDAKNAWYRASKVAPLNQAVRAVESEPLLLQAPISNNATDGKLQVTYEVRYAEFAAFLAGSSDYQTFILPSMSYFGPATATMSYWLKTNPSNVNGLGPQFPQDFLNQSTALTTKAIQWSTEQTHGKECFNINLSRCGDNIVDSTDGEQCDLGAQNGSGSTCSATCKTIDPPLTPDVYTLKTGTPLSGKYLPGTEVEYTLTYGNNGPGVANGVIVTDTLPSQVTYVGMSSSNPTLPNPTINGQTLTWNIGTLAAGASGTIKIKVRIAATVPVCTNLQITNNLTVFASNEGTGQVLLNNPSSFSFPMDCPTTPDVYTLKTGTPLSGMYLPGMTVEYTLTYGNNGPGAANGVVVTDTLPATVTYIDMTSSNPTLPNPTVNGQTLTWNIGTLAAGASGTIKIRVRINATVPICTNLQITNNLTVFASNEPSTVLANNPSSFTFPMDCIVKLEPDVTLVKSVVGRTTGYNGGDTVTYKITYRNIGQGMATNVIIADELPANVTFVSATSNPALGTPVQAGNILTWPTISTLAPSALGEIFVTVKLNTTVPACMPLTNKAGISASNELPIYSGNNNGFADITTACTFPDVFTLKTGAAISGYYLPGMIVEYTLYYKNQGQATANGVVLTDTLPSNVTYVSSVSNPTLPNPTINGQVLTWNVGALTPNQDGTVTVKVRINANTPICTNLQVVNNLTVTATNEPSTLFGNNPSSFPFVVQCYDLWSNKVVDKPIVVSGDVVTYTISYGNRGDIPLAGVVTDVLPTGMNFIPPSSSNPNVGQPVVGGGINGPETATWDVGVLQPGAQGTITFKAKISQFANGRGYYNTVCITGDNNVNNNNCGSAISTGGTGGNDYIDLSIDKTPKLKSVTTGEVFDYTLTVRNAGTVGVNGYSVNDYLPIGLEFVSTPDGGIYNATSRTVTRSNLSIPAVGTLALTVKVKYIGGGEQINWTEICNYNGNSGSNNPRDIDSNPCNGTGHHEDDDSSGKVYPGVSIFDLSIDKLINGAKSVTVVAGTTVTVTLNVTNSGTVGVNGFSVNDYMPTGLNYVAGSSNIPNTTYDATTRKITFPSLNIGSNQTFPITFQAVYNDTVTRTNYTEICDYAGTGSSTFPQDIDSKPCNRGPNTPIEDDESSAQIGPGGTIGGGETIDLSLNKLVNGVKTYAASLGEEVTFTIKVKNDGNKDFSNVTVVDYLPVGVDYVAGTALPNAGTITVSYDVNTRRIVWSGLNLAGGGGGIIDLSFKAKYNDTVARTNFTEVCNYPGKSGTVNPKDSNSDPCNRGPNTPIEDDESSASITPKTGVCTENCGGGGGRRNYCGDAVIGRPNSNGQREECDLGTDTTKPDYNGKPGGACSITCNDTRSPGGFCGDRIKQIGEICDQGPNGGTILTGIYAGKMCSNTCSIGTKSAPMCDYIDPPSIQKNEYLPYRWDLENIQNVVNSCTAAGQIVRSTVKCEFTVTDAKGNTVEKISNQDCYQPLGSSDVMLKSAYVQTMKSLGYNDPFMDKLKPYGYDARKFGFDRLGEHKISLAVTAYSKCDSDGTGFVQIPVAVPERGFERVCEMNFAVTKPYMVSRGPLGNFASDPLTSFLSLPVGDKIFDTAVPQITTKFDVTQDAKDAVNKLVSSYEGLAVSAGVLPGTTKTIKKVPGKDVYLVDAGGTYIAVGDSSDNAAMNKPFTLIITNGDLVVKGNLTNASRGMYIVKNGDIKYSMEDCNVTQAVQGIFITLANVVSLNAEGRSSIHNTNLSQARCNAGDLTIKGVIIGNGVKAMAESTLRRSNVNTWFTQNTSDIQADRQEYLLNHGSLVLKYNPDLFDNLPPGADVLSQVLSTYKK